MKRQVDACEADLEPRIRAGAADAKLRVLVVHNHYREAGGESVVFGAECALLRERRHHVLEYTAHNDSIAERSRLELALATLWNQEVYEALRDLIRRERPDIAHFHNIFPLISPAAYYAAASERVAVVQTLHNYRLLCPNAVFFRNGGVCEDCLSRRFAWPGVLHACYRNARTASAGVGAMLGLHRALRTWQRKVHAYIALTRFARRKFCEGGLPAERIFVKPHFVHPDPGVGDGSGGYALFVGRLSAEKGLATLLAAWRSARAKIPLVVVGEGPLGPHVAEAAARAPEVTWLPWQPAGSVYDLMGRAMCVIVPSECYETFGRVIIESFAKGTPVIASRIGALAELVRDGRTGLHCAPGDPEDLAGKVEWVATHPDELARMREDARAEYATTYTAETNYEALMEIYARAVEVRAEAASGPGLSLTKTHGLAPKGLRAPAP